MNPGRHITLDLETGQTVDIAVDGDGRTLTEVLSAHGFPLNTRCGLRGLCKGCEVEIREGSVLVDGARISAPATVRACRARTPRACSQRA